ncbi:MAG: TetR/AcrR family transcriptional regulator, partial [Rhodobacter sp.]|nr:TetR/AcrR family transcriptional regulator [Rhodobacter sp.]
MARKPGSRADITGPRLRDAALRLFARDGYAAVSMRQIAAEVGVQAGALYLYTADKQSLLFELMQGHMDDLLAAWAAGSPPDGPAPARLEHFARFHIRFHAARADAVFIAYMELRNLTPENFAVIETLRRRYETELEEILRAGQQEGTLRVPDTKLATMALIAMLTGVNTWFREGGRLSLARVEEIYVDMVLKAA